MTVVDVLTLLRYRLRPLEPYTLGAAAVAAIAVGVALIPGGPAAAAEGRTTGSVTIPLTIVALSLASTVGFVAGRDVDVAEPLLTAAPRPYRRALVLRVVLWAAVLAAIAAFLGGRAALALDAPTQALRGQALVYVLFVGSLALVLSRALGSLAGGGAALGVCVFVAGLPFVFGSFPVVLLGAAGSDAWAATATRLELLSAGLIATAYWRARP